MNCLYTPGKIRTFTGKYVDPFNLQPEDVCIEDIAHALSHQCRFAGHTQMFYSVAEHSLRVCNELPPELKIYGLLHDASEAYLIDLPTPIKKQLPEYQWAEKRAMQAVAKAFNIDSLWFHHSYVRAADKAQLEWEWENFVIERRCHSLTSNMAKSEFIRVFNVLTN